MKFLIILLIPVAAFAHGTVAEQVEAVTKRSLKDFAEKNPDLKDGITTFAVEKTGDELFVARIKAGKKEYFYNCGLGAVEKDKWGCKAQ